MQPAQFAKIFLQDLDLPLEPYAAQIEASITQQLADATGVADVEIGPAAGGLWASRDPPPGLGRAALPPEEREKDARSWDWGLERRDWTGKRKAEAPLESGVELGEVEDDLRVIVDVSADVHFYSFLSRVKNFD